MIPGRLSSRSKFTPVPACGFAFGYMIPIEKCRTGTTHTGTSSPRFQCRSANFIPVRNPATVSRKRGTTTRFGMSLTSG